MPLFDPKTMDQHVIGADFSFSATRIGALGATEYTLVAIAVDASPSVQAFKAREEACVAEIVKACRRSPRADNLMLRLVQFHGQPSEIHGFKPLPVCNPQDYAGCVKIGAATACFDAAHDVLGALAAYGRDLKKANLSANAVAFVITDGEDNVSKRSPADVRRALYEARTAECLESVLAILVGVNVQDTDVSTALRRFRDDAGFDAYIEIDDASEASLAKLAAFASRSIHAQSKALGSGVAARAIGF